MSIAAALAIALTLASSTPAEAATARVTAGGECLNLRQSPTLSAPILTCIDDGGLVSVVPGAVSADGMEWDQVRVAGTTGWVAARYLTVVPDAGAALPARMLPTTPGVFEVPPPGGLTFGIAGTSSPAEIAAAQAFPVAGISTIDPATQQYLTYIPGAPALANTLTEANLRPEMAVMVRRAGTLLPSDTSAMASGAAPIMTGMPYQIPTPARGGLALGVAGTNEIDALIRAQPFAVDMVTTLDIQAQRWLTYIPGAPDSVNTLNRVTLRPTAIVFMRRSATAADPPPPVMAKRSLTAPITYYYCTQNSTGGAGDGGGFCGFMSNGMRVQPGAASCDRANFGQRFRVVGDPLAQIYTCMDTGGGVSAEHRDIWFATSDEAFTWWKRVAPTGFATIEVVD